jgi:DNA-binding CsgD family transcriptional regulator
MLGSVLRGRATEIGRLDDLVEAARGGRSGAVVLRGEAGIGKTALLRHVASRSDGALVLHAEGVEAEMELPFATLHQLCAPLLDALDGLPPSQGDALRSAFGLSAPSRPDHFLVGLAVLTLLSNAAEAPPLVCLVDDTQWLDSSSAHVLSFVARRIEAEGVLIVFAERDSDDPGAFSDLPELRLQRLSYADAREIFDSTNLGVFDERVRDRIIAETRGNPLALFELPRALDPTALAGGFAVSDRQPLQSQIEASFRARAEELPEPTRRLLLLAAAEPLGDPALLWRAGATLGLASDAAAPAEAAELIVIDARVTFRHPLLRSAIYGAAPPDRRRTAHAALAEATDPELDADRRAWHRAHASLEPDEDVAAELERCADGARARGGLPASAAFLERAVQLTPDARRRTQRALRAARLKRLAGYREAAAALVATAEQGPMTNVERALAVRLRALMAWDARPDYAGALLLLDAARQLEPLDADLARDTHLEALIGASNAGRLGDGVATHARAARLAPPPSRSPDASDLLLDGLAVLFTEGKSAAAPMLKEALSRACEEGGRDEHGMRSARIASRVAAELMDERAWEAITGHHVQSSREDGVLGYLPATLNYLATLRIHQGNLGAAEILLDESGAIDRAMFRRPGDIMRALLAAYRGDEPLTVRLCENLEAAAAARGEGLILAVSSHSTAVLRNSLGHYEAALSAARDAPRADELSISPWSLPELIEAAVHAGQADVAADALEGLVERTSAAGTDVAVGIEARSRALLLDGAEADGAYRQAIDALGRTTMRMLLARAQLVYGEWLRRENRRSDSRVPLEAAHEFFTRVGADGFAERAARELHATGATPRRRTDDARSQLTPQEAQIAELARDGHTNPEIGAMLYLSPRTVEWHLRHVFMKLEISSRRQLRLALADGATR